MNPISRHYHECPHDKPEKERRQSFGSARLVCRLFDELASPFSFVWLEIGLSQKSLDFVEHLSRRPRLAKGVRHLTVWLDYCPGEAATDLQQFKRLKDGKFMGDSYFQSVRYELFPSDDERPGVNDELSQFYNGLLEAWDAFDDTDYNVQPRNHFAYLPCLRRWYADYQKRHREQFQLISQGTFVQRLAASLKRMPCYESLLLLDDGWEYSQSYISNPTVQEPWPDEIREYMRETWNWIMMHQEMEAELVPAKILVDLPVALHNAGISLRKLQIGCFPMNYDYNMLEPRYEDSTIFTSWNDLAAACRGIEEFALTPFPSTERAPVELLDISDNGPPIINAYFTALLSSQRLKRVDFSLFTLGGGNYALSDLNFITRALSTATWPPLQTLHLEHVPFFQADLERLCVALPDTLEKLFLDDVTVNIGIWARALDILRNKYAVQSVQGKCKIQFKYLDGGEFCGDEVTAIEMGRHPLERWPKWKWENGLIATPLVERYVTGHGVRDNPLRGDLERILDEGPC
jgi:hypothetical protein